MNRALALLGQFAHEIEDLLEEGFAQSGEPVTTEAETGRALLQNVVDRTVRDENELLMRALAVGCDLESSRVLLAMSDREPAAAIADTLPEAHVAHRTLAGRSLHSVVLVSVPPAVAPIQWLRPIIAAAGVPVLLIGPSDSLNELYDRYLCAVPVIPHLSQLGQPGELLLDGDLVLAMIAASIPRDVRGAFVRTILRRPLEKFDTEKATRLRNVLADTVTRGLSASAVRHATGTPKSTV